MSPKSKKILIISLISLGGVLAFLLLILLISPLWLGPVAASVARSVVPKMTGCEFKLDSISLNPYSGKLTILDAHLLNPPGYDAPEAFSVATVRVDVAVGSLFSDTIHVRDIQIDAPYVSYVFDDAGTNNFARMAAHAAANGDAAETKPEPESAEPAAGQEGGKKLVIDRLSINGTKIRYRKLTMPIPLPTLTDIGKESGGATFKETCDAIWVRIKDSMSPLGDGLTAVTGTVTDGAKVVGDAVGDGAKAVGDAVGDGAKAVTDGAKAVGEGAKDALKKVGNLFGK